jgi:TM2 domain-containing membrane protein YozV
MSDDMLIMLCIIAGAAVLIAVSWPTSAKTGVRFYIGKTGDSIAALIAGVLIVLVAVVAVAWLLGLRDDACEWNRDLGLSLPPSPFHVVPCPLK